MFDFLVGNDLLSGIVAFILVLIPAVLIHELGHFAAAKLVGITILEFGIGMPPRMVKLFTYKGTDYTLNWLPLGGFVRPLGEDLVRPIGEEALVSDRAEAQARGMNKPMSVNEAKPWPRILFFAGGALANFVMAFILFTVVALIGLPEVIGGRVYVSEVSPGSALEQAGLQENDYIERINGETFADLDAFLTVLRQNSGEPVVLNVVRGERVNADNDLVMRPVNLDITFTPEISEADSFNTYPIILDVAPNSPAANAGLQGQDLIVSMNNQPVPDFATLRSITEARLDQATEITVLRGTEEIETSLTPRSSPPEGEGAIGIVSSNATVTDARALGIRYQPGLDLEAMSPQPLGEAVRYSAARISEIVQTIASVPGQILQGNISAEAARPVSVVGIGQIGGMFLQQSVVSNEPTILLNFIAVISIALGLTNLLPLPALDGGRILFVLIELVRGKPISPEREGMVHLVGMALLLSAMVLLMFNDVINPVTEMMR